MKAKMEKNGGNAPGTRPDVHKGVLVWEMCVGVGVGVGV